MKVENEILEDIAKLEEAIVINDCNRANINNLKNISHPYLL